MLGCPTFEYKGEFEKQGIVFLPQYFPKCFSRYILLTCQVSLSDCFYFLRYWAVAIGIACFSRL